jgi:Zn-finger nucleic acid-binding protein
MQCPKCRGNMRTFDRNGIHIEQCENCRGIFLDYGELESLTQLEAQWRQAPPPPAAHAPAWGAPQHGGHQQYGHHNKRHGGFFHSLFSS